MKTLFSDVTLLFEDGSSAENQYLVCKDKYIDYIGDKRPENVEYDRIIDCRGKMLMPGMYNTHAHVAMNAFRGFAEDLPLQNWLFDKIFPAEDLLTQDRVYNASMLAIAEQLKHGIVSFSDMYFFSEDTIKAVIESGIKANISRGISCFEPHMTPEKDYRFCESKELCKKYHGSHDGRIKIDMGLHAEYTLIPEVCEYVSDYAKTEGLGIQLHLSETFSEHEECIKKYGKTPTRFFSDLGAFDVPATAAHCVAVDDDDIALLSQKHVNISHNPTSNLKLGSGIADIVKLDRAGLNISLGTDGAASNNTLDIRKEGMLASLLQKGIYKDPAIMPAEKIVSMITRNGASAQGRADCGRLSVGAKADLCLIDIDTENSTPMFSPASALLYTVDSSDVAMTVVDGNILYENGSFTTIDIEKIKAAANEDAEKLMTQIKQN